MKKRGFKKPYGYLIAAMLLFAAFFQYQNSALSPQSSTSPIGAQATLSPQAKHRLLYGTKSGGGHKHGVGKPCKSEFPASWSDEKIFLTVEAIAANDNLRWRHEGNDYHVTEDIHEKIKIRVVVNRENNYIVSAYPLNTPRNPCPANDN